MSQKYQKEWSDSLQRNVWFVETPGISYKGGILSERSNICKILRMKGTKKKTHYNRLLNVLNFIMFKMNMSANPFKKYLRSLKNKKVPDVEIYANLKRIRKDMETPASKFDRGCNRAKKISELLTKSMAPPVQKYLDYGCGSGEFTRAIGDKLGLAKQNIFGVDIVHYSQIYDINFKIIKDSVIPHPDNFFDLITVQMVLHHIKDEDLRTTIKELYRVLKPNGTLILREHNVSSKESDDMTIILDFVHEFYDEVLSSDTSWKDAGEYYARYQSLEKWDDLLTSVGFSLNAFQAPYNASHKYNAIAQYMRMYNKLSWDSMLEVPSRPKDSYKRIPFFRILTEDLPRVKYRRRNRDVKNTLHWGQRKLLLSEIEFLTMFYQSDTYKKNPDKKVYMVYAGSAPGTHIRFLWELFPEVYFVLYDPREFDPKLTEKPTEHIQTHIQLFLDETAEQWRDVDHPDKHILLVSDIRTAEPETMESEEVEDHIRQDNQWQKQWYQIMDPAASMFKFRLPWDDKYTMYPSGDIHIQIFPPLTSTETRLIVWQPNAPEKKYDHREYEERMFRFNTVERSYEYDNPLEKLPKEEKEGLNNKYDSVGEIYIIQNYLQLMNKDDSSKEIVHFSKKISKKLSKSRTLESDQPLKKYSRAIVEKLKELGDIPVSAGYTRKTYHDYVLPNYDSLVERGILDPDVDEGGISFGL